eukprot:TCONS_00009856-protein
MCYVPKRYVLSGLIHFATFCLYSLRVNLSVAIVSMVNQTYANAKKTSLIECGTGNTTIAITQEDGEFLWDQNRQGLILGAFFYGYLITQVPGGWLANRYGGKWVYAVGMLFCNIMTALTPVAARTSYMFLIAARVIEGLGQVRNHHILFFHIKSNDVFYNYFQQSSLD